MHPRNRYSARKPDFVALAKSHPPLREHLVWKSDDYATLDFKSPSAQKELTRALLMQDFHLDVDMPVDKLIPTVPQKLNYIHWIEDLLSKGNADNIPKGEGTRGIDIGTGPACIYPLLATFLNKWSFIATEIDPLSADYAVRNVSTNGMEGRIEVRRVDPEDMLVGVVKEEQFDFCMCNPPFYSVNEDRHGDQRPPPPHSSSSGQAHEVAVPGGEVGFVSRMVEDSLLLPSRVRWFTSMVGKKESLKHLRALLRKKQVPTVTTTELVQGVTRRWAIAWSFTEQIPYNPSHPPSCIVPLAGSSVRGEGRARATQWLERVLTQMEISYSNKGSQEMYTCTAEKATWANQRRKRRLLQMMSPDAVAKKPCGGSTTTSRGVPGSDVDTLATTGHFSPKADALDKNASSDLAARLSALTPPCHVCFSCGVQPSVASSSSQAELELKLELIDGSGPQDLQQIAQYLKNNWSPVDSCQANDESSA